MIKKKLPSEKVQDLLTSIVDNFDKDDMDVRQRQIRQWRGLKLFWDGFSRSWYSEVAHDWRIWDDQNQGDGSLDQSAYDKPVNVFKAYLESIIAALSVTVPPIKCYPDDAQDPLDLLTARAGDKICQLVYRHNNVQLLWVHALYIFCTEGVVAGYNYADKDRKYGTYEDKQYEETEEEHTELTCPNCGGQIDEQFITHEENEFSPDNDDAALHNIIFNTEQEICPNCAALVDPELKKSPLVVTRLIGITNEPKSRQCIEVYGGLNVKVPAWARKQSECPYLSYAYETHYTTAIEMFPHLRKYVNDTLSINAPSGNDLYERWGRTPIAYRGEFPEDVVTIRSWWIRPSAYNFLQEDGDVSTLKRKYPDGCKVTFVNDNFADACNSALDDCWTISYNPLADYIHHQPLGMLLVSIQEITNDLLSLILQTIEHGIPQTFADPTIMDFKGYKQLEVLPGSIIPTKTIASNRQISQGFYEVKTATLSAEILPFANKIQELGQLVSGALPSLFGGNVEGSGTASEYSMSRAQALQRLQTTWKITTTWWKEMFGKVIPAYIKDVVDDENQVERRKDGSFINIAIKKAELEGKLGRIELEANENLPISWNQQKDMIFQLLQSANPEVLAVLAAPENLPIVREALGLVDFYVPGEDDRNKQYEEIKLLLNSEPIVLPPPPEIVAQAALMGQPPPPEEELPSVEIDPVFDNHQIEFEICRSWITSEEGRQAKQDNPAGYKNVLLHGTQHMNFMQSQMAPEGEGTAPPKKPNKLDKEVPIEGEGDVKTA